MRSTSNLLLPVALLLLATGSARAGSSLLYLEAQGVAGYSGPEGKMVFYSMTQAELMQKPSVGFDYIGRISGETGDIAVAALQLRLALNADPGEDLQAVELQVYNAYLRYKGGWADVWAGHNRPALGLSSYLDSHGLLLRTLAMQGFGFDRDWGVGAYRDTEWGDLSASVTTGTGAPLRFHGNWMAAARAAFGVLTRDNATVGISVAGGRTLETMGNEVLEDDPAALTLVALDAALLRNNLEHRLEVDIGTLRGEDALAVLYRFGILLDPEGRWKVEAQPAWVKAGGEEGFRGDLCISFLATGDLTLRLLYSYDGVEEGHRGFLQAYYYARVNG